VPPTFDDFATALASHLGIDFGGLSNPSAVLTDAGIDSIGLVEIQEWMLLSTGVDLPDDLLRSIDTLGELYEWMTVRAGNR